MGDCDYSIGLYHHLVNIKHMAKSWGIPFFLASNSCITIHNTVA